MEINQDYTAPNVPTLADLITGTQWNHRLKIENYFNVKNFGALGDGVNDDSPYIQAAVNAAVANGGGTIFFPDGIYVLEGDLSTDGANAIIPLPYVVRDDTTRMITLRFKGEIPPAPCYSLLANSYGNYPPLGGVILYAKTSPSGLYPCVFGSPQEAGVAEPFSNIYTIFENITIRQALNPALIALRLQWCTNASVLRCSIDVDALNPFGITSAPSNSNGLGVVLPNTDNSGRANMEDSFVTGYYRAVDTFEHSYLKNFFVQSCGTAIGMNSTGHSMRADRLMLQWCNHYLQFMQNGSTYYNTFPEIGTLNIEGGESGYWWTTVDHINDSGNHINGILNFLHLTRDTSLVKTGGSNLQIVKQAIGV